MSAQVLDGFMADISAAIIAALRGPRGPEIAALVIERATSTPRAKREIVDLRELLRDVAKAMGVTTEAMRGRGKPRAVTDARAVFAHLARQHTRASLNMVGRELGGQDHSTIRVAAVRGAKLILTSARARAAADVVARNTSHGDGLR